MAAVAITGGALARSEAQAALTDEVILFASDGMRPDLVDKYAGQGAMPTMAELMADGVKGKNGLLQGFPPNTGVGWATLATGAWPGVHGSTNNTFYRTEDPFTTGSSSFAAPGILQADTIAQSAERAGKTVVAMEWVCCARVCPGSCRGRWSTSVPSSRLAASSPTTPYQGSPQARPRSVSRTSAPALQPGAAGGAGIQRPGDRRCGRLDERPCDAGNASADAVPGCGAPPATTSIRLFDLFIYDTAR